MINFNIKLKKLFDTHKKNNNEFVFINNNVIDNTIGIVQNMKEFFIVSLPSVDVHQGHFGIYLLTLPTK